MFCSVSAYLDQNQTQVTQPLAESESRGAAKARVPPVHIIVIWKEEAWEKPWGSLVGRVGTAALQSTGESWPWLKAPDSALASPAEVQV